MKDLFKYFAYYSIGLSAFFFLIDLEDFIYPICKLIRCIYCKHIFSLRGLDYFSLLMVSFGERGSECQYPIVNEDPGCVS